jgi:electron transfer flavoprotein beta subunit
MNITVLLNMVPDMVEELEIDASGVALDTQWLRYVLSESDDHALEQALLLKDQRGARVAVLALDRGDADEALYAAMARGADEAIKLSGVPEQYLGKRATAAMMGQALKEIPTDLILTGIQAIDDMDGHVPGLLAGLLSLPYVGVTRSVDVAGAGKIVVRKEYPGGLLAEMEVDLPAVIGVLSAPQPPRYVPVARIRETRKTRTIAERRAPAVDTQAGLVIRRLFKPEAAARAEMLNGSPEDLARQIVTILDDRGLLR